MHSAISVPTLAQLVGNAPELPSSLSLVFKAEAIDGAGNISSAVRVLRLVRNAPPVIDAIRVLDNRGNDMGNALSELTEGRAIVIEVRANDPELFAEGTLDGVA